MYKHSILKKEVQAAKKQLNNIDKSISNIIFDIGGKTRGSTPYLVGTKVMDILEILPALEIELDTLLNLAEADKKRG